MKILLVMLIISVSSILKAQITDGLMTHSDFEIDEKIVELIKKLEWRFNRKVTINVSELQTGHHGSGQIMSDSLVIEIGKDIEDKNELLLHELLHFEIKLKGVPIAIGWALHNDESIASNKLYLSWFKGQIWDKIHHHFFYPIMVSDYGYDPYFVAKSKLTDLFETNEIPGIEESTKKIALACKMLYVFVETNDETYLKNFEEFLYANYGGEGIQEGNELIHLFKSNDFTSVASFPSIFVDCFNLLHENIKIKSWKLVDSNVFDEAKDLVIYFN